MNKNRQGQWALVTGASSGLGLEFAKRFAQDGIDLILTARNESTLQELAQTLRRDHSVQVVVILKDLNNPEAPGELFEEIRQKRLPVHFLINNAGFGTYGPFHKSDLDLELAMIQVNNTSLVALTRLFLPEMIERRQGRVMNVASTAAFQPGPWMAVYYASKAFVLSFSEAVGNEVNGTGVTVTAFCPGSTKTDFQKRAGIQGVRLIGGGRMSAEQAVQIGYQGMMKGKPCVIPGFSNRFLATLVRWVPRRMVAPAVRWIQETRIQKR